MAVICLATVAALDQRPAAAAVVDRRATPLRRAMVVPADERSTKRSQETNIAMGSSAGGDAFTAGERRSWGQMRRRVGVNRDNDDR